MHLLISFMFGGYIVPSHWMKGNAFPYSLWMKGWWKLFLYAVAVFQQFNFRSIYLTLCNSPTLPYCVALPYLEINLLHLKALLTGFPIFKEKLITYFRPPQGKAYKFKPSCTSIFHFFHSTVMSGSFWETKWLRQ